MKARKSMMDKIQGCLPKEPSFPKPQKTKMAKVNQKTKKPTQTRLFIGIFAAVFTAVFITMSILEVIGLGSYASYAAGAAGALASVVSSVLLRKPHNYTSEPIETKK